MHGLRRAGSAFLEDRDAPCQPPDEVFGARTPSPHALSPPPPPSQRRRQEASRAGACKEASGSYPPRQSRTRPRPIAVVEVMNKRGGGVFNEHDEEALLRVCACVESLLRRKAAEVALLKSGMTERSCRNNGSCGGGGSDADGAASSNRARVESTIMRLYSEYVSVDAILSEEGEQQAPKKMKGAAGGDDGMGGSSGGNGSSKGASGGGRAEVDDFTGEENMTEIESGFASPSGQDGGDDSGRRARDGRWTPAVEGDAAVGNRTHGGDEGSAVSTGGVEGPNGGVCRQRAGIQYNPEEDAELMNLNTNLFEMSTVQQLSLMERFFRSMGLTEHFHVSSFVPTTRLVEISRPVYSCEYPQKSRFDYSVFAMHDSGLISFTRVRIGCLADSSFSVIEFDIFANFAVVAHRTSVTITSRSIPRSNILPSSEYGAATYLYALSSVVPRSSC